MRLSHASWILAIVPLWLAACGDDKGDTKDTTTADATTTADIDNDGVIPAGDPFAFSLAGPGSAISAQPFPNDLLRDDAEGRVEIAPLKDDARFATLAVGPIIDRLTDQISRRKGFSYASSVYFPMGVEPDLATFQGKVHYVALSGPEEGKVFDAEVFWFAPAQYLGAHPAWGNYLVPGAKYAVIIDVGVHAKDGSTLETPTAFADLVAAEAPAGASAEVTRARGLYEDLRDFLATRDQAAVVGTVFTTEDSMAYLKSVLAVAHAQPLVTPTRNVRSTSEETLTWETAADVHGADLEDYFGTADGDSAFAFVPGGWEDGNRASAAALTTDHQPYDGGTMSGQIGWVINGSIVVPSFNLAVNADTGAVDAAPINIANGEPVVRSKAVVPFSLFLCPSHVDNGALTSDPIHMAIFTHGGTALRSDGLAYANLNCLENRATIVLDLPFHGGRQKVHYFEGADLVVPTQADAETTYKPDGAPGRTTDYIGDNGGATTTVGGMFALNVQLDPEIIEANLLAVAVDHDTLVRYLDDTGATGLGAALGVTFDTSDLVHESLSFGTSFGTAFLATSSRIDKAVTSVGSGMIISANLPMAPNNSTIATGLMSLVLKVKSTAAELAAGAYKDPIIAMFQWIAQRGDPMGYAPFALRYRDDGHEMDVVGYGDSWDETLFTPAQISFANAWGIPVFESDGWALNDDIPGSATTGATAYGQAIKDNVTIGARTITAGYFYFSQACHAEVVTPVCVSGYQPPYPPPTKRAESLVFQSPICAIQKSVRAFLESDEITAPPAPSANDCSDLYD